MAEINDFDAATKQAFDDFKQVHRHFQKLLHDYRRGWKSAASRSKEFDDAIVERNLKRAEMLLQRDGYQVSLLGTFSSGKSILCNGLLEAPGFLPSSLGVCTLAVTEVDGASGMSGEGVVIKYMTLEGAYRKVFGSDQFRDQLASKLRELSPFNEEAAKQYVQNAIEAYDEAEDQLIRDNATRLRGFLDAVDKFRDRLNTTWTDSIDNKDDYLSAQGKDGDLSGGLGEGHMWLIERVFVTVDNNVLARENVRLVDLPGVDAPSAHDKEVTFAAVPESDAAILVVGQRGFAMSDRELIERIGKLSDSVRDKIFVVINKMDTLNEKEIREFEKAFWPDLIEKMHQMGLSLGKLYFTSAYYEEARIREKTGELDDDGQQSLKNFRASLAEKLALGQSIGDEGVKERLMPVFVDGGVTRLRNDLYRYLQQDIKRERLRDIWQSLRAVAEKWDWLIDPERSKIDSGETLRREMVSKFFREQVRRVENLVAQIKTGEKQAQEEGLFDIPADPSQGEGKRNLQWIVRAMLNNVKKRSVEEIVGAIFHGNRKRNEPPILDFGLITSKLSVLLPVHVRQEALNVVKPELKARFQRMVLEDVPRTIMKVFRKEIEQLDISATLDHFAREFREPFTETYSNELKYLERTFDLVTELKVKEILAPIDEWQITAQPGEPQQWNDRMQSQFVEMLEGKIPRAGDEPPAQPVVRAGRLLPRAVRHLRARVQDVARQDSEDGRRAPVLQRRPADRYRHRRRPAQRKADPAEHRQHRRHGVATARSVPRFAGADAWDQYVIRRAGPARGVESTVTAA
jgi:hypothetical protein